MPLIMVSEATSVRQHMLMIMWLMQDGDVDDEAVLGCDNDATDDAEQGDMMVTSL